MIATLDALGVSSALRDLGREERARIGEGRIELLEEIAVRRADLLRRLDEVLPKGAPVPDDVRAVLDDVRREGTENMTLLRSLQSEIAGELGNDQRVGHAVRSYGETSRF